MRIVCLIEDLGSGGAERQLSFLAVQLKKRGYDVVVWTYYPNIFYKAILDESQVPFRCISAAKNKIHRIPVLYRELKKYHPDVVISYLDTPCMVACMIKMLGIDYKLIVSERNTTQIVSFKDRCKFFLYHKADYIVPNSYTQARFIEGHFPKLSKKIRIITNMVDTDMFAPSDDYSSNSAICRIISVGRVMPQKNTLLFVQAATILVKRGYNISVHWYGDYDKDAPDYYQSVIGTISTLGIGDVFKLCPATKSIAGKYVDSDVFCLPSLYEGFPNVLCEAMSCGLPVICSNVCDNPTIVKDGINGFVFNPRDVNDLVDKIIRFIELDNSSKYTMRQKSREIALRSFSSEVFIGKYIDLLS